MVFSLHPDQTSVSTPGAERCDEIRNVINLPVTVYFMAIACNFQQLTIFQKLKNNKQRLISLRTLNGSGQFCPTITNKDQRLGEICYISVIDDSILHNYPVLVPTTGSLSLLVRLTWPVTISSLVILLQYLLSWALPTLDSCLSSRR